MISLMRLMFTRYDRWTRQKVLESRTDCSSSTVRKFDSPSKSLVATGARHVREYELRLGLADNPDGFGAVLPLRDHFHFGEAFEEENEFVARRLFIVHNQRGQLHGRHQSFRPPSPG